MAQKNTFTKLPAIYQTENLRKVWDATAEQLFQPGKVEKLSGFIGRKPAYFDPEKDFYVPEMTPERDFYQLEPTAIVKDAQNNIAQTAFYQDLPDYLRFAGGLDNLDNRLFDLFQQTYYSWSPPVDLDKVTNFFNYFWLPAGPDLIDVTGSTDVESDMLGALSYTLPDNTDVTSGMRVVFRNDVTPDRNDIAYIVEGVGRGIILVEDEDTVVGWDTRPWDTSAWDQSAASDEPDYVTMERGAADNNPWSRRNRWFHRDTLTSTQLANVFDLKAVRPIIEFQRDLELYNYGSIYRGTVNFIAKSTDVFGEIDGEEALYITDPSVDAANDPVAQAVDGIQLRDGVTILAVNDTDPTVNGRVYKVEILKPSNLYRLVLQTDGVNSDGSPADGEILDVKWGLENGDTTWYYNVDEWVQAQNKTALNQAPLFQLYDVDAVRLDDPGVYPISDFQGSRIFTYAIDNTALIDPVLGRQVKRNNFGEPLLSNVIATERYTFNDGQDPITGYYFHRRLAANYQSEFYSNDWYPIDFETRQYLVEEFQVSRNLENVFEISQVPAPDVAGQPTNLIVEQNGEILEEGVGYSITGKSVQLASVEEDDLIIIRSWNPTPPDEVNGFYEVPLNLQANPENLEVDEISKSEFFEQFTTIIRNQDNLDGSAGGTNNYRDTAQKRNFGRSILQHSGPLLKTLTFAANPELDVLKAMRFGATEFTRYRNRMLRTLLKYTRSADFVQTKSASEWVEAAIDQITIGKNPQSPFYYSGVIEQGAHVPPTPSVLGLYPVWKPEKYTDDTFPQPTPAIRGHDGSVYVQRPEIDTDGVTTLTHNVKYNDAILNFETQIYNGIDPKFKTERLNFVPQDHFSGKFRSADYTVDEFNQLLRPIFERWAAERGVNYRDNRRYDPKNPFSWNYGGWPDRDGEPLPGSWRAVYRYYFDTIRPHSHPWEMLGFGEKPSWWDTEYGSAPYTSGNTYLWNDIRDGRIRHGDRAGIDSTFVRPGLYDVLPVSSTGTLLDPMKAKIVLKRPPLNVAAKDWKAGQEGPIETIWRRSEEYPFAVNQASFLAKPPQFLELGWDPARIRLVYADQPLGSQWIYEQTRNRPRPEQLTVHTEELDDGTTYIASGVQQWIASRLIWEGISVPNTLGNTVRRTTVQLGHKIGGFGDFTSATITAENFGVIPAEDYQVTLHENRSTREEIYSGVIVEWTGTGYRVLGYDVLDPVFRIIPSDPYAQKFNIVVGDKSVDLIKTPEDGEPVEEVPYGTEYKRIQDVFDFLISYERWLKKRGWNFNHINQNINETEDWTYAGKQFVLWSQADYAPGAFIALSPAAKAVEFETGFGRINPVERTVNGVYSILTRDGSVIQPSETFVTRYDGKITIEPEDERINPIFSTRLNISEVEHVLTFNNRTIFNDLIYDPLLNLRQPRLRVFNGLRSEDWKGRYEAPGFIITDNNITANYERTVTDFQRYFSIENPTANDTLRDHSRHLIGYEPREYLRNLLFDDNTIFQFYQGMLQAKGTEDSFTRLFRSEFVTESRNLTLYEEWAFRLSRYGATENEQIIEFEYLQSDVENEVQLIEFKPFNADIGDLENDETLNIPKNSTRWLKKPEDFDNIWPKVKEDNQPLSLPTPGNVRLDEIQHIRFNKDDIGTIESVELGDRIWTYGRTPGEWDVQRVHDTTTKARRIFVNEETGANYLELQLPVAVFRAGDWIYLNNVSGSQDVPNWVRVEDVIRFNLYEVDTLLPETTSIAANVWYLSSVRLEDPSLIPAFEPIFGWNTGDLVWLDNLETGSTPPIESPVPNTTASKDSDLIINGKYVDIEFNPQQRDDILTYWFRSANQSIRFSISEIRTQSLLDPNDDNPINMDEWDIIFKSATATFYSFDGSSQNLSAAIIENAQIIETSEAPEEGYVLIEYSLEFTAREHYGPYRLFNTTYEMAGIDNETAISPGVWDQPLNLTYSFAAPGTEIRTGLTDPRFLVQNPFDDFLKDEDITLAEKQSILEDKVREAFDLWEKYANIQFTRIGSNNIGGFLYDNGQPLDTELGNLGAGDIRIGFAFPGQLGAFGSGVFPVDDDTTPNALSGTIRLNPFGPASYLWHKLEVPRPTQPSTEIWRKLGKPSEPASEIQFFNADAFQYTFAHEVGHAIGIAHLVNPNESFWRSVNQTDIENTLIGRTDAFEIDVIEAGNPNAEVQRKHVQHGLYIEITNDINPENNKLWFIHRDVNTSEVSVIPFDGTSEGYFKGRVMNTGQSGNNFTDFYNKADGLTLTAGDINAAQVLYGRRQFTISNLIHQEQVLAPASIYDGPDVDVDSIIYSINKQFPAGPIVADKTSPDNRLRISNTAGGRITIIGPQFLQQTEMTASSKPPITNTTFAVQRYDGNVFETIREEDQKLENRLVSNALIYDRKRDRITQYLTPYDPAKGIFPGIAEREIKYKLNFNPAKYTNGDPENAQIEPDHAWGKDHWGELWYDLSTTRFLDYEISDNDYRRQNWGRLAPEASVDVYEWVQSSVPPSGWANLVRRSEGQPDLPTSDKPSGTIPGNAEDWPYTVQEEYSVRLGRNETKYYFWVLNKQTVPPVPFRNTPARTVSRIIENPTQFNIPWFSPISEDAMVVSGTSQFLDDENTVLQVKYRETFDEGNIHSQWILHRPGDPRSIPDSLLWNKMRDSLVGYDKRIDPNDKYSVWGQNYPAALSFNRPLDEIQVPNPDLNVTSKYGSMYRPRQGWFVDMQEARTVFYDCVNTELANDCVVDNRLGWDNRLFYTTPEPNADWVVPNLDSRDSLPTTDPVQPGDTVLVTANTDTLNRWTLWTYTPAQAPVWRFESIQLLNLQEVWDFTDFYADEFGPEDVPAFTFSNNAAMVSAAPFEAGTLIRVDDDGSGRWEWHVYNADDTFTLVGKEDCTIEFNNNLWKTQRFNPQLTEFLPDPSVLDTVQALENYEIIRTLKDDILTSLEQNKTFFCMVNQVHAEQDIVDWAFKTSYVTITGIEETLDQDPLFKDDNLEEIIDYIEEVKPYHVKVRDFIRSIQQAREDANVLVTDFDKPPRTLDDGTTEILDPNDPADADFMANNRPWTFWWNNYLANPDLIRRFRLQLLFDRTSCHPSYDGIPGAYDRILESYRPTAGMEGRKTEITKTTFVGEPNRLLFPISPQPLDPQQDVTVKVDNITQSKGIDYTIVKNNGKYSVEFNNEQVEYLAPTTDVDGDPGFTPIAKTSYDPSLGHIISKNNITIEVSLPNFDDLMEGCEFRGTKVKGMEFGFERGWDLFSWDATGWDAVSTSTTEQILDVILQGGSVDAQETKTTAGNGTKNEFKLPAVPIDATVVEVIVDGVTQTQPGDYTVEQIPAGTQNYFAVFSTPPSNGAVIELIVNQTFSAAPDNPSDILIDGYRFHQPHWESDHPEERVPSLLRDSTQISVYQQTAPGAPVIESNRTLAKSGEEAGPYRILQIPASVEAVQVHVNGNYVGENNYQIDMVNATLTFTSQIPNAGDVIKITSFTAGGGVSSTLFGGKVIDTLFIDGDGTTQQFDVGQTVTASQIFVTVNGEIRTFTIAAGSLVDVGSPAPGVGTDIIITVFDANTTDFSVMQTEPFVFGTDWTGTTLSLPANVQPSPTQPKHATILVQQDVIATSAVDAKRLRPPYTEYFLGNGFTTRVPVDRDIPDRSFVDVYQGFDLLTQGVDYFIPGIIEGDRDDFDPGWDTVQGRGSNVFTGDGSTTAFAYGSNDLTNVEVEVNGSIVSPSTYTITQISATQQGQVNFNTAPTAGANIVVSYDVAWDSDAWDGDPGYIINSAGGSAGIEVSINGGPWNNYLITDLDNNFAIGLQDFVDSWNSIPTFISNNIVARIADDKLNIELISWDGIPFEVRDSVLTSDDMVTDLFGSSPLQSEILDLIRFVTAPPVDTQIAVVITDGDEQFTVPNISTIEFNPAETTFNTGDVVYVTAMTDDRSLTAQTEVFGGRADGVYSVAQTPPDSDNVWVTRQNDRITSQEGGEKQVLLKDYRLDIEAQSWDVSPWDAGPGNANRKTAITLQDAARATFTAQAGTEEGPYNLVQTPTGPDAVEVRVNNTVVDSTLYTIDFVNNTVTFISAYPIAGDTVQTVVFNYGTPDDEILFTRQGTAPVTLKLTNVGGAPGPVTLSRFVQLINENIDLRSRNISAEIRALKDLTGTIVRWAIIELAGDGTLDIENATGTPVNDLFGQTKAFAVPTKWDEAETETSVVFPEGHDPEERIVITTYGGLPQKPPVAFRVFTNTLKNFFDPALNNPVTGTTGMWSVNTEDYRIADQHKTFLRSDLNLGDTEFEVHINPDIPSTQIPVPVFSQPNKQRQIPGAVFINGELIEFYGLEGPLNDGGLDFYRISEIQRAREITAEGVKFAYQRSLVQADGIQTTFALPTTSYKAIWVKFVRLSGVAFDEREKEVFTGFSISGSNVVFAIPPENGVYVNITVLTDDFITTTLTHPAGSLVIDSSVNQRIPGGYKWEASPVGLQRSGSRLARFLLEKFGSNG